MNFHPIPNEPALVINNNREKIMVVGDLHIGIETAYRDAGANIPSQTDKIIERLEKLCTKNKINRLVLLGDIKHTVPQTSWQELQEIPELFYRLEPILDKIDIVIGNHDGNFRKFVPELNDVEIEFQSSRGFKIANFGFFHGHTWPLKSILTCDYIFIGHNHPIILFTDELGGRVFKPCWVRGHFDPGPTSKRYPDYNPKAEIIIIPAFNNLGTGTAINHPDQELLGPILKNGLVDIGNSRIFLLDGTFLGKLQELIKLSRENNPDAR